MILSKIRSRIQRHMRGERTEELIFVSRQRFTMQRMFQIQEKFRQLVDQWRFMDATFAPLIEFRDEVNNWVRRYESQFIGMLPALRGVIDLWAGEDVEVQVQALSQIGEYVSAEATIKVV